MMKVRNKLVVVFITLLCSSAASAQLKIEEVLRIPIENAIQESADVRIKSLNASKTELEKLDVESKRKPHVSALGAYGYLHSTVNVDLPTMNLPITGVPLFEGTGRSSLSSQVAVAGVSAQQVIFTGLQIPNAVSALEEKFKAETLMVQADQENIAKDVIYTFDQLMLLKEVDKLVEDSEKRLTKEHQRVLKAIENGLAIPYDRDKLKLAMLELEEKKVEVEGNRGLLYAKLQQITHMNREELEAISYDLIQIDVGNMPETVENRAEVQALKASSKAQEYLYKKEKGALLPTVFAFGSASYINAFDSNFKVKDVPRLGTVDLKANHLRMAPTFMVGIGAKWSIFDGGEQRNKMKKVKIDQEISEAKLNDTEEKLALLLKKNKIEYKTAKQKLLVADQQIRISDNNLNLASKRFQEGLIDMTERLSSENESYKVNLNFYNQVLNQRQKAVELFHTAGVLLNKIFE